MGLYFEDHAAAIYCGDVRAELRTLPAGIAQTCVTSPPYWGLRDYGVAGQLGLEATPEEYVASMVDVFREVKRVLRDDGTLWLNIGDTYATGSGKANNPGSQARPRGGHEGKHSYVDYPSQQPNRLPLRGFKPTDLVGVPWMLAFALRADGWYLRSEVIWHKRSPMPESVRSRPTKAHEQVFLLSKSRDYFYDVIGSAERVVGGQPGNVNHKGKTAFEQGDAKHRTKLGLTKVEAVATRNMRDVWSLATYSYKGAHFATYPPELVRRCLSAGISERGCCEVCGASWVRIVETIRRPTRPGEKTKVKVPGGWDVEPGAHGTIHRAGRTAATYSDRTAETFRDSLEVGNRDPQRHVTEKITTGWRPSCECVAAGVMPTPSIVLDPFHGAGTTMCTARRLGYRYVGVELNPAYIDMSIARLAVPIVFSHERKAKRTKQPKQRRQQELFGS